MRDAMLAEETGAHVHICHVSTARSVDIIRKMKKKGVHLTCETCPQYFWLTEDEILRTIAFFRYINPEANIRLAAGRALLTNDGETAFKAGASATITGNMLTTAACATIRSDRAMLADMGRDVTPDYWKEG